MTNVEVYAFFISPFMIGAACLLMVWLTSWDDKRQAAREAAAHPSSGSLPKSSIPKPDGPA